MPKEPCKRSSSQSGIETEIQAEGYSVFVSFRDAKTGETVMLTLHRRASAALWALLGATDGSSEDAGAMTATLRGTITFNHPKAEAENENERPPTVSASQ